MSTYLRTILAASVLALGTGTAGFANPFAQGWDLDPQASALRFQSIKNNSVVETSSFATFGGSIDPNGVATMKVLLDSVDTKVDLRNVRMRFLFFETFQFPEAEVSTRIDPALIADLESVRRKVVSLPFSITLHGVTKELSTNVSITLLNDDMVSVSTFEPLQLSVADFNLAGGLTKLEEAAGVKIVPSTSVTFDLLFARRGGAAAPAVASLDAVTGVAPAAAALEVEGDFDLEACKGRFEILSRTDNIYFAAGSARLEQDSSFLLDQIADIVNRCPGLRIEVGGHTDSDGGVNQNQRLSELRAGSVADYLTRVGVSPDRFVATGYGEASPVVPNTTPENKRRNRRIEFSVVGG